MKNIWFWLIILLLFMAIYGTLGLVIKEIKLGDICPKAFGIPACYIVLFFFIAALGSHVAGSTAYLTQLYYAAVGVVTLIALTGTLGEIIGFAECPRTSGGIPMCYISLGICLSLLLTKFLQLKLY